MSLRIKIVFTCFLLVFLCGCQKKKIVIEVPIGNTVTNTYIDSAGKAFDQKDYYNSLNNYLEAEKIYLKQNYPNDNELAEIYSMIGRCYIQLSEYHKAKDYFEKSLHIGEKSLNDKLKFENYFNLIKINYSIDDGNLNLALEYGNKAEKIALKVYGAQSAELGDVYSNIGVVYCNMGKYDKAYDYLQKALNIMNNIYGEDNDASAVIYKKMADMFNKKAQYTEAEENLKKAIRILKNNKNDSWLGIVYGDLGRIYYTKKEYKKALEFYNKCLEVYSKLGKVDFNLAKYHYWKSGALYNLNNYEESKQEMLLSHQICESLPVKSELTETLISAIKNDLNIYYDYNYKGDKSTGFEEWYKELISSKPEQ